jgi:hypothetical protein
MPAQKLTIDTGATAMDMAEAVFGQGITVQSASFSGSADASGVYSGGDAAAPGITPSDTGVILSTGTASDVTNDSGDVNASAGTSTDHGLGGDSGLTGIAGQSTFDAALFEAEFVPDGSVLTMQVTFSSEEYLEYVNSGFNDAVGVWVNGVQADLTVGDGDITINNINDQSNANLYLDNAQSVDAYNTEMDGLTVTLTLKAPVTPGAVNAIKIGIADGGDGAFDSNLMIAGDSVQTALVAGDDDITLYGAQESEIDLLANDSSTEPGTLTITMINGQPVGVGDSVTLATGEVITLTETGMVMAAADGGADSNVFSYEVTDSAGNTDVAFVNLTTVPCFVAGTLVDTECGPRPVELLQPGMRVMTRDHGPQTVRWVGVALRRAEGRDAPVRVAPGALGATRTLCVSPNHRLLIRHPLAEAWFGTPEVLVAAKFLAGLPGFARWPNGHALRYVHILFDRHEVIETAGLWSESYHPGPETLPAHPPQRTEILRLFPQMADAGPAGYGPTARPVLRAREARALAGALGWTGQPGRITRKWNMPASRPAVGAPARVHPADRMLHGSRAARA